MIGVFLGFLYNLEKWWLSKKHVHILIPGTCEYYYKAKKKKKKKKRKKERKPGATISLERHGKDSPLESSEGAHPMTL